MIRFLCWSTLVAGFLAGCAHTSPSPSGSRVLGVASTLGGGTVASYADLDSAGTVQAVGLLLTGSALDNLPAAMSDGHHCFDFNNDGTHDLMSECSGGHERILPMPSEASRPAELPFKWTLLNWNPHGHIPPGIYDKPHFDIHFVMDTIENVFAIMPGPCGPEKVRCDHFARARMPVPANYMHADFKDVEAVAPAMGNHLIDLTGSEFHGVPFTRTWIYGSYEGRVTFYEEMISVAYLRSQPDTCTPIKRVPAVAVAGRYPTRSCVRYSKDRAEYTVSLEGFELREASPPAR